MLHSFDRLKALYLAGTVAIPAPFPQLGSISLATVRRPGNSKRSAAQQRRTAESFLQIDHIQSPRLMISRTVAITDVQAVFVPECAQHPHFDCGEWHVGGLGQRDLVELLGGPGTEKRLVGMVYVKETAPVLMQVEVGMTAAESVEYYPPVVKDRTDAHYNLGEAAAAAGHLAFSCDCSEAYPLTSSRKTRMSCDCS